MSNETVQETAPSEIAARYRVRRQIARGGMGAVFEVVDARTGRALALKQLRDGLSPSARERVARLFEQEYHTLSQLRHPRVVEVYDFQVNREQAFYTMELLDGGDLRELAPLPWRRACELFCEVCSALSLLHSRRLLHRDLTARNIRCTRDGKAKLIDFGAMAHFGPCKHAVGTPSFTAPEVLTGQVLDARTDLFSLGAALYYALTGRHAYPASSFGALRNVWRSRPVPPSRISPDVPKELDTLVLSLLQLAPVARPASAAEVMEKLSVIGGVELDEQLLTRQAYLTTPTLVGRDAALLRVRKQLVRATRGRGGAFFVRGAPGIGRSRFLDACVLEGKLLGAVVLRADASDATRGEWAGARELLRQLHVAMPDLPAPPLPLDDEPLAVRLDHGRQQAALYRHLVLALRSRCVLLAIDDLDRIDNATAALIALLAHAAGAHALCVLATAGLDVPNDASAALPLMQRTCAAIELAPLCLDDTEKLLSSVFGEVPNLRLLADRLHAVAEGCPRALMQLAQHLLDKGLVVYRAGAWTLPSGLDAGELPASLGEALRSRVAQLSTAALRLARGIVLSGRSLTYRECLALSLHGDSGLLLGELDELIGGELLRTDGERYNLSQPGWEPFLLAGLGDADRRDLHQRLAAMFDRNGESFLAMQHTFWAGRADDALDRLLALVGDESKHAAEDYMGLVHALRHTPARWREVLEALLERCVQRGRPRREQMQVRFAIAARGIVHARPCDDHIRVLFAQLAHDSGQSLAVELEQGLPDEVRLKHIYSRAQQRYEATAEAERGLPPADAIRDLGALTALAIGVVARSYDYEFLASFPSLAVFTSLSRLLEITQWNVTCTMHLLAGRSERAREGYLALIERYRACESLPSRFLVGFNYAVGSIEASIGIGGALQRADTIESDPSFVVNAWRLRMLHATRQGDFEAAAEIVRRLELVRVQNDPPQQFEGSYVWVELLSYTHAEDLTRLKQLMPSVEEMAREVPAWKPFLHYARAQHHRLRGDAHGALAEAEQGLALIRPGQHQAWCATAGAYLDALLELGRVEHAVEQGRQWMSAAKEADLGYQTGFIARPLALAEAALGDHDAAVGRADATVQTLETLGATGLNLGRAYDTRARVAIAMDDREAFERCALRCAEEYRAGVNPVLTLKYERLLQSARRAGLPVSRDLVRAGGGRAEANADLALARVRVVLEPCADKQERARAALQWLIAQCGGSGGFLYTMQAGGPLLIAEHGDHSPPYEMDALVNAYLSAELDDTEEVTAVSCTTEVETMSEIGELWPGSRGDGFVPLLLSHQDQGTYAVTGVAVLCAKEERALRVADGVLPALSLALYEAGDVAGALGAN